MADTERDSHCPTCGSKVRVVMADEGTSHYVPVPVNELPVSLDDERTALLLFVRNFIRWDTTADLNRLGAQARGLLAAFDDEET
jgi:hypothetical protein